MKNAFLKVNLYFFISFLLLSENSIKIFGCEGSSRERFILMKLMTIFFFQEDRLPKLEEFDKIAVVAGGGCLLLWIGSLRFLKLHRKFSVSTTRFNTK